MTCWQFGQVSCSGGNTQETNPAACLVKKPIDGYTYVPTGWQQVDQWLRMIK
jgi:hypothetical protein